MRILANACAFACVSTLDVTVVSRHGHRHCLHVNAAITAGALRTHPLDRFFDTCVDLLKDLAAITDINRVTARDAAVLGVAPALDAFCNFLFGLPRGCIAKLIKDGLVDAVVSLHRNQPLRAALQSAAGPNYSQATHINYQLLQCLAASLAPERVVEIGIDQRAAAIAVHRYEHDRRAKLTRNMHCYGAQQQQQQQQQRGEQSTLSAASSDETVCEDWADPQLLMNFLLAMSTLPLQYISENPEFRLTEDEREQLSYAEFHQRKQEFAALQQAARDKSNEQVRRVFGTLSKDSLQLLPPVTALLQSFDGTAALDERPEFGIVFSLLERIARRLFIARCNEFANEFRMQQLENSNEQRRRVRCEADAELLEEQPGILQAWWSESDTKALLERRCWEFQ